MRLYHTGAVEIREPDILRGRKNADFGQGFYLTPDMEFARRWARGDAADDRPGVYSGGRQNGNGRKAAPVAWFRKDIETGCGAPQSGERRVFRSLFKGHAHDPERRINAPRRGRTPMQLKKLLTALLFEHDAAGLRRMIHIGDLSGIASVSA